MKRVWPSPAAGVWYQNSKMTLAYDLEHFRRDRMVVRQRGICALVVPHAALRFSGETAAGIYLRADPRSYSRVVILAPSHYEEMPNTISALDCTHILTPLGEVAVDLPWLAKFRKMPFATEVKSAHLREHSDQIQLPLIQTYLSPKLSVVCLVTGRWDSDRLLEAAEQFRTLLDDRTLLIVSSDFTHLGPNFGDLPSLGDEKMEKRLAGSMNLFELFATGDVSRFLQHLQTLGHSFCARDPLPFLMAIMPDGARVSRVGGGRTADGVEYTGAVVRGAWSAPPVFCRDAETAEEPLTEADGARLIAMASAALRRAFLTGSTFPVLSLPPANLSARLRTPRGGFVTWISGGVRRGCMGELLAHRPVWQVVAEQSLQAAFRDVRVAPLESADLQCGTLEVEIEILGVLRPVDDWCKIDHQKEGVLFRKGILSAFLLPSRVTRQPLRQLLATLALKAGADEDAWRERGTLWVFASQRFRGVVERGRNGRGEAE